MALDPSGDDAPATRSKRVRARTVSVRRFSKRDLEAGRVTYPEPVHRLQTRAECENAARPCPFVGCKHHLYLDVNPRTGAIKLNFPHLEPWELATSCALDVANRGEHTLEEVAALVNLTRERIRQLETRGLSRLRAINDIAALHDYAEELLHTSYRDAAGVAAVTSGRVRA